jgi:hypothetical protein
MAELPLFRMAAGSAVKETIRILVLALNAFALRAGYVGKIMINADAGVLCS